MKTPSSNTPSIGPLYADDLQLPAASWSASPPNHRIKGSNRKKALGPAEKRELLDYAHESHKLRLRQACIRKLGEATALTQAWLWMYNNERPHESLGYKSPVDFAQELLRCKAPQTLLCDSNFNRKSLVLNASN